MKHAAPVRKELGMRTIFNILGPLTNPAGAKNQVMGVFHPDLVGIQVRVLQRLGSKHVMMVHGLDGLDEISISGPDAGRRAGEGRDQRVPAPSRRSSASSSTTGARSRCTTVDESKAMIHAVLENQPGPGAQHRGAQRRRGDLRLRRGDSLEGGRRARARRRSRAARRSRSWRSSSPSRKTLKKRERSSSASSR